MNPRKSQQKASDVESKVAASQPSEFSARSVTVLAACFAALFCTAGIINAFGVFQTYYARHYLPTYSNFQISWLGSFNVFTFYAFSPISGLLFDKFGPILPVCIGSICQLVAIFMISLCKKYYQFFLAQGVLLGIGMSFITNPSLSVLPMYFQRNRALASGIVIAGSSLGGVIWPLMLDQLLNHDEVSFGWTLRIVGFIQIPLLAIVTLGIQKPQVIKPLGTTKEKDTTGTASKTDEMTQHTTNAAKQIRQPAFLFLCIGLALYYFGFFAPFFFVSDYGLSLGESESFSIYLISILNAASLFGRILPGLIADRTGHFNVLLVAMFGSALVNWCWTAVQSTAGLIVWSAAYGFISGAVLSLQFACASVLVTKPVLGVAMGTVFASIALTALFGSPISGELVERGYLSLSAFAGATTLGGSVLVFVARLHRNRNILAKA